MLDLPQPTVERLIMLAYREWAAAFDSLKAAKEEQDDSSADWLQFHVARLEGAIEEERTRRADLDAIAKYTKITI